jgi:hypothetical protein
MGRLERGWRRVQSSSYTPEVFIRTFFKQVTALLKQHYQLFQSSSQILAMWDTCTCLIKCQPTGLTGRKTRLLSGFYL